MKIRLFLAVLITMIGLQSCKIYQDVEVRDVTNFAVTEFSMKEINAEIELEVHNPNWYKIKLVGTDIDLYVNDKYAGKVTLDETLTVPKKSDLNHTVKLTTDVSDAGGVLLQTVMSALFLKKVKVKAEGDIKAKAMLVGKKVYVSFEDDVELEF